MKRALICSAVVLTTLAGAFYSTKVNAQSTELKIEENNLCFNGASQPNCSGSPFLDNFIWQRVDFQLSANRPTTTIKRIGLGIRSTASTGSSENTWAVLLNSDFQELASSTVKIGSSHDSTTNGYYIYTFPTEYTISLNNSTSTTPAYIGWKKSCSGTCGWSNKIAANYMYYGSPYVGSFHSSSTGAFSTIYVAGSGTSGNTQSNIQIPFQIYETTSDIPLKITNPIHNQTINSTFSITGTCSNNVSIQVGSISSDFSIGFTALCSGNTFSFPVGILEQGFYVIEVQSGSEYDSITFYFLAQSIDPTLYMDTVRGILADFSCNIPYFDYDPCAIFSDIINQFLSALTDIPQQTKNTLQEHKPYSYAVDLYDAVYIGLTSSSTQTLSTTIAVSTEYFSFNGSLFSPDTMTRIFTQQTWNSIRSFLTATIWLVFAIWFVNKARSLV